MFVVSMGGSKFRIFLCLHFEQPPLKFLLKSRRVLLVGLGIYHSLDSFRESQFKIKQKHPEEVLVVQK